MNVVLIGAGLMGSQIGCEYTLGGHRVTFVARRPDVAGRRLDDVFALAAEAGLAEGDVVRQARHDVRVVGSGDDAPEDVDLVVESIVESFVSKTEVLAEAANRWPDAIIASNTSSLSITELGNAVGAAERIIGTHYWNPPILMPLVEVIPGASTDDRLTEKVTATLKRLGKRPVRVQKDVPGFVWNRLQLALLREAAWIVENGVASPEVVDEIVRDGLARRWRLTGPFETVALGGPDTFTRIASNLFPVLSSEHELRDIGRWLPDSDEARDRIRTRRDRGLLAELRQDQEATARAD